MLIGMINLTSLETQKHYSTMLPVTHIFKFNPTQTLQYLDSNINGLTPLSK